MPPIRAIPSSDGPSDQSCGRCAQTAQRSYGSAPPHCESCPRPTELCLVWALATESLRAAPVPGSAHCRRPHRLAHAASCEDQSPGRETLLQAVVPLGRAARLLFDNRRSHWLRSRLLPTAWRKRHSLSAVPSRTCRDPRGWGQSARPFFCRLLGAIEQHLIPVDPLQGFIPLGQLSPSSPKGIQFQPEREPPLHGFVGGKTRRQHAPPNPRYQNIEHGVQTLPVVVGRISVATPDHRRKNRLKEPPHLIGHLPGKVGQLHAQTLPLCSLGPVRIMQEGSF